MAVTFTREFYINFGLFLFACVALGLSIWAFATPCKKDGFGKVEFGSVCCPDDVSDCPYSCKGQPKCPEGETCKYTGSSITGCPYMCQP